MPAIRRSVMNQPRRASPSSPAISPPWPAAGQPLLLASAVITGSGVAPVELVQLRVGVLERQRQRSGGRGLALDGVRHLCLAVLKPARQHDPRAVLLPAHGVLDRLNPGLADPHNSDRS